MHYQQALLSLAMLLVSFAIFFAYLPAQPPALVHAACFLLVVSSSSLLLCASMDPGVLPRCPPSPMVDLMPDTVKAKIAYCPTCHVVRAPRTKQCVFASVVNLHPAYAPRSPSLTTAD